MRWLSSPDRRAPVAVGLLALTAGGALLDAWAGGRLMDTPVVMLAAAAAGLLAGAWLPPSVAAPCCAGGAAGLTAANQVASAGQYSVPNDLFFFAVLLGGTALVGAVVSTRRTQVTELRRLTAIRQEQRAAEVRAGQLEEGNRIASGVVESLAQRIGALVVQSAGAGRDLGGPQTLEALARMEDTARDALAELREVVGTLREPDASPLPQPVEDAVVGGRPLRAAGAPSWRPTASDVLAGCSGVPVALESVASAVAHGPVWANAVAGIAVGAPLVVRRRHPVGAVVAMMGVATVMSARLTPLPATVSILLPVSLAAYSLGSCVPPGRARGWWRAGGLVVLAAGTGVTVLVSPTSSVDGAGLAPTLLWLALAFAAGVVADQHAQRARELSDLLDRIEAGRQHELRLAVAEQRNRSARLLHDSVAHAMTVVCLQAEAAQQHPGDESLRRGCVATIEATARGAMDELRQGLVELDGPRPDLVRGRDLADAVAVVAASLGVDTEVWFAPQSMAVPGTTADVVRRLVREALVNVARHAPRAMVQVRCEAVTDGLEVEVVDQGSGHAAVFDRGTGTGLRGLGEVVRAVGGRLEHGRTPSGYRVAAHLPCDARVPVDGVSS